MTNEQLWDWHEYLWDQITYEQREVMSTKGTSLVESTSLPGVWSNGLNESQTLLLYDFLVCLYERFLGKDVCIRGYCSHVKSKLRRWQLIEFEPDDGVR